MKALFISSPAKRVRRGALAAFCAAGCLSFASFAAAQSLTPAHLQAARQAIAAIHATDQFDSFLPETARAIKNELSQRDPNLAGIISQTVDEQTMLLIPRRADLEKEAARVYAKHFSETELNDIAKFYSSATGKKLLREGPAAMAESVGAYEIWRQGVAQDLTAAVGKALDAKLEAEAAKNQSAGAVSGGRKTGLKPGQKTESLKAEGLNFGK